MIAAAATVGADPGRVMTRRFDAISDFFDHGCDAVIDVRSPAEFAEDHVPGAINLPVLDNEERARVGTLYKQDSPFRARKVGAALVFRNAAAHIETALADKPGGWRPLVYCWRGGQRSGSFAWMLREIGWPADTVAGGYRSYRRLVVKALYDASLPVRLVQLGGHTGTAKTALLSKLRDRGVQVLDLEALANHRGSLLGAMPDGQPSQKAFDTRLAQAIHRFDPARPVVVEAESSKIGRLSLPKSLWDAMKAAPWIVVDAPVEARAAYLAQAYSDVLADAKALRQKLAPLRHFRGGPVVDRWSELISAGDNPALCKALVQDHYDPAYTKSMRVHAPDIRAQVSIDTLAEDGQNRAADAIFDMLQTMSI